MAYPKTSAETKMKFIADVINQLEERGSTKEAECLRAKQNLDKQYESAQRYSRIMKEKDEEDAETSPTDQMPYEHPQEVEVYAPHVGYSSPYKNKQQSTVRKLTKERRKMLMEKHVDLLDWIQCVDDGIVKGNLDEAQREMSQGQVIDIMTFNSYSLQYYSFRKGKIGFARTVPVSWTTPMSIASVTVDS